MQSFSQVKLIFKKFVKSLSTNLKTVFSQDFQIFFVYRADDEDDYVPDNRYSRGGAEKVILPTAPRASLGSAIDSDRIPNVSTGSSNSNWFF